MTHDDDQAPSDPLAIRPVRLTFDGLEPIDMLLPDVTSPAFAAEARRQSELVANSPQEKEDLAFIASLADEMLAELDRLDGGW